MGFVDGLVLRTQDDAARFGVGAAAAATDSLVDVQVAFHALDVDEIGLGDLARHRTGYVARQLHPWHAQVEGAKLRQLPLIDEVHEPRRRSGRQSGTGTKDLTSIAGRVETLLDHAAAVATTAS